MSFINDRPLLEDAPIGGRELVLCDADVITTGKALVSMRETSGVHRLFNGRLQAFIFAPDHVCALRPVRSAGTTGSNGSSLCKLGPGRFGHRGSGRRRSGEPGLISAHCWDIFWASRVFPKTRFNDRIQTEHQSAVIFRSPRSSPRQPKYTASGLLA
jgi:hypothetical protein